MTFLGCCTPTAISVKVNPDNQTCLAGDAGGHKRFKILRCGTDVTLSLRITQCSRVLLKQWVWRY